MYARWYIYPFAHHSGIRKITVWCLKITFTMKSVDMANVMFSKCRALNADLVKPLHSSYIWKGITRMFLSSLSRLSHNYSMSDTSMLLSYHRNTGITCYWALRHSEWYFSAGTVNNLLIAAYRCSLWSSLTMPIWRRKQTVNAKNVFRNQVQFLITLLRMRLRCVRAGYRGAGLGIRSRGLCCTAGYRQWPYQPFGWHTCANPHWVRRHEQTQEPDSSGCGCDILFRCLQRRHGHRHGGERCLDENRCKCTWVTNDSASQIGRDMVFDCQLYSIFVYILSTLRVGWILKLRILNLSSLLNFICVTRCMKVLFGIPNQQNNAP